MSAAIGITHSRPARLTRPSGCLSGPGERTAYRIGLASDDLQVGLRRFIGIAAVLLPIAQRPERDAKGFGKLDLRHVQRPANALRQRNAANPSKASGPAVLNRQRRGIGSSLGQHLTVRLAA